MFTLNILQMMLSPLSAGVSLFAANVLFLRRTGRRADLPLALFFVADAIAQTPMLTYLAGHLSGAGAQVPLPAYLAFFGRLGQAVTFPCVVALAPAFLALSGWADQ